MMSSILKDTYDLHIHAGPDVISRKCDDREVAKRMSLLQGVQKKEKTVPEEVPGADRGAPPFGRSWPEVINGRPGADP